MPAPRRASSRVPQKSDVHRNIKRAVLGDLCFPTWFDSWYPEELVAKDTEELCVCRWCFRYSWDRNTYAHHAAFCGYKSSPPGTQIYGHGGYSVWELDGEDDKLFAQNLSLFAKLFLDHKSVLFDVSTFLYYLLVYADPDSPDDHHILGYFSKEKMSWDPNNLACILVFPPYQHKQLGSLLMGVSYKLSGWEWESGRIGGPERPLSVPGEKSYIRFWNERIARYFLLGPPGTANSSSRPSGTMSAVTKKGKKRPVREEMTINEIGQATGMLVEDVITALKSMGVVEAEKPSKRRKKSSAAEEEQGGGNDKELAVVKKQNVLEWAKIHRVCLQDPVREEAFLGEWAPDEESRR